MMGRFKLQVQLLSRIAILAIVVFSPRFFPKEIIDYYSQSIYPIISSFFWFLFGQTDISIGDIFGVAVLAYIVIWIIKGKKSFKKVLNFFIIFIFWFQFSWGLNYYRTPVEKKLQLKVEDMGLEELKPLYERVLSLAIQEKANWDTILKSHLSLSNHDLSKGIQEQFKNRLGNRSIPIRVKNSLLSEPISYLRTSGYLNPFTHEAHVNKNDPIFTQGFTACHEAAHQMGIARENEASYYGFIASASSSNPKFRYSAYFTVLGYLLRYVKVKFPESFESFYEKIPAEIILDFEQLKKHSEQYETIFGHISSTFYDLYLKLNNQKEGRKSYGRVTNLIFGLYRKELSERSKDGLLYNGD